MQIPPEPPELPLVIDDQLLFDLDQERAEPAPVGPGGGEIVITPLVKTTMAPPAVLAADNTTVTLNNINVMVVSGVIELDGKAIQLTNTTVTVSKGFVVG